MSPEVKEIDKRISDDTTREIGKYKSYIWYLPRRPIPFAIQSVPTREEELAERYFHHALDRAYLLLQETKLREGLSKRTKVIITPTQRLSDQAQLEAKFNSLLAEWRKDVMFLSSVTDMSMHPAYQRIIGMGYAAVPLLLKELEREPDDFFWALSAITGENPIKKEDAGNLAKMSEAWLEWGRNHNLL